MQSARKTPIAEVDRKKGPRMLFGRFKNGCRNELSAHASKEIPLLDTINLPRIVQVAGYSSSVMLIYRPAIHEMTKGA